jgi:hypothetical protein
MFKFGYGFYVIRRNNAIPFVNGGISASIRSEQPQWTYGHEAVYTIRLYNFIVVYQGASPKPLDESSANHIKFIPKQDSSYRNIIMRTAINIKGKGSNSLQKKNTYVNKPKRICIIKT